MKQKINEVYVRQEIAEYLKQKGWNIALLGDTGVVKNPNKDGKLNMWFIMEFIGKKKKKND